MNGNIYILTIFYSVNGLGEITETEGAYTTEDKARQAGEAAKILYVGCGYYYHVTETRIKV